MINRFAVLPALLVAGGLALATSGALAEVQKAKFKVVGTWHNLTPYQKFERPFWEKTLPQASGGKITGNIHPITELGLKGWEVARLLKLGVFDAAFGAYGYVASEDPAVEGVDLSSVSKDFATGRKVANAYAPVLAQRFDKTFKSRHMLTYPFPSQLIWCNAPIKKLTDLKGKKVRVYSTTLGDFVEVVPALQKGVADCGITGTMPAFQAKWHEVITHAMKIRVGMGLGFFAISNKGWNGLNKDTQDLLWGQAKKLENEMWAFSKTEDDEALRCLSGKGDCSKGTPGSVTLVEPSADDFKERDRILRDNVLKKWAARCSADCVKNWNDTVSPIIGVKAVK